MLQLLIKHALTISSGSNSSRPVPARKETCNEEPKENDSDLFGPVSKNTIDEFKLYRTK